VSEEEEAESDDIAKSRSHNKRLEKKYVSRVSLPPPLLVL
jgi:hypothetical protein